MGYNFQAYAQQSVPRYTSYPTAPQFSDAVGADDYARWLEALDPAAPLSLYLHVPFCRELCWYCGCNMKLATKAAPISDYASRLIEEVRLVARHMPGRMKVSHLHWGGGTPTALEPDDLARVMEALREVYDVEPGAELAIESDPRTLSDAMIARIGALGFTRASFGVQEFDADVQAAINRIQPPEMVRRAVDGLRDAGVAGINFDLIYGLPLQTVETLTRTIDLCAEMAPDRIAIFGYAHVPWVAKKQKLIDESTLPDHDARVAQSKAAAEAITGAGYRPVGLDHFARPEDPLAQAAEAGTLRRNFQGYTTDDAATLIGMGTTSIGRTPSGYVQNIRETRTWDRVVSEGRLPVMKGVPITAEDAMRGRIIEELMCQGAVDPLTISRDHGIPGDWLADLGVTLAQMATDGLITRQGTRITMVPEARHLVRVVAALFDAYRADSPVRYSLAV
ncbi:MAG: oxygen-independent coproporphyrinogen III oxidase [Silicimonas sp.]|nr:oxygen-independent coproporphyrinogen III oxidase [Silicimonas sp.]